jgi:hypothetical protein
MAQAICLDRCVMERRPRRRSTCGFYFRPKLKSMADPSFSEIR